MPLPPLGAYPITHPFSAQPQLKHINGAMQVAPGSPAAACQLAAALAKPHNLVIHPNPSSSAPWKAPPTPTGSPSPQCRQPLPHLKHVNGTLQVRPVLPASLQLLLGLL